MDTNFVLYGISLTGLVIGLVRLAGEFGLAGRLADLVRSLGLGMAFLLVTNAGYLESTYPWFEDLIVQGGGFLSILLLSMGYGPSVSRLVNAASNAVMARLSNVTRWS